MPHHAATATTKSNPRPALLRISGRVNAVARPAGSHIIHSQTDVSWRVIFQEDFRQSPPLVARPIRKLTWTRVAWFSTIRAAWRSAEVYGAEVYGALGHRVQPLMQKPLVATSILQTTWKW